ncbi:MAG TPA: hypothetical protein VL242_40175 [Sorangium sp.]|nr:hypothetical protein [Sorangium sp.]
MIEYLLHVIAMFTALAGVFGKTVDTGPDGKPRIRLSGVLLMAMAMVAFCGSLYKTMEASEQKEEARKEQGNTNDRLRSQQEEIKAAKEAIEKTKSDLGEQLKRANNKMAEAQEKLSTIERAAQGIQSGSSQGTTSIRQDAARILKTAQELSKSIDNGKQENRSGAERMSTQLGEIAYRMDRSADKADLHRVRDDLLGEIRGELANERKFLAEQIIAATAEIIKKLSPPPPPPATSPQASPTADPSSTPSTTALQSTTSR